MPTIKKPKILSVGSVDDNVSKKPVVPKYHGMAAAALVMSHPGQHVADPEFKELLASGPLDLYKSIKPIDALDSVLAMLLTAVTSTSLDCLAQAANLHPEQAKLRDLNLRLGFKGCTVANDLVKTLRGREKLHKVTVGEVNVEAGGQAIVGNIESAPPSGDTKHPKIN
jgi:hypothetical protein